MQGHQLKPIHKIKKAKRVGRGGKKGTYSGKGIKGQSSRAGRKFQPIIRELIKRYPKLKGYRRQGKNRRLNSLVLNLDILEKKFNSGEEVTPKTLLEKGVIGLVKGRLPLVKILSQGEITKSLVVKGCFISEKAKAKIEKAGGKVEVKEKVKVVKEKKVKVEKEKGEDRKKEIKKEVEKKVKKIKKEEIKKEKEMIKEKVEVKKKEVKKPKVKTKKEEILKVQK